MNRKFFFRLIFLHVLLPLLAGFIIYLYLRENTWLHGMLKIRFDSPVQHKKNFFLHFLAYSGPDFCWSYSLASAMFLWKKWYAIRWKYFFFIVLLVVSAAEMFQMAIPSHFTFDITDLVATIGAVGLSAFFINNHTDER